MSIEAFKTLFYQGYHPRTLLDIGAHIGSFTQGFWQVFPDCVPTLIEPNPFCADNLKALGVEYLPVAASRAAGVAELFLTKEWLQSTGTSLYRENTHFFRDETVVKHEVATARLDDLFPDRRFDFVKIDVQGSELDVLLGGDRVLRQADYILIEVSLVEYNAGAAPAEAVVAQLAHLGFRCADITGFHRLNGVLNGALLQLDFLFERIVKRPTQNARYTTPQDYAGVLAYLSAIKAKAPDFPVIDLGGTAQSWAGSLIDVSLGRSDAGAKLHFQGDLSDVRAWDPVLKHVARHGRFGFCLCAHSLSPLAAPSVALEMLPRIAEAGFIAVPSRFLEMHRHQGPYRGYLHHRWIIDRLGETLALAPKIALLDYFPDSYQHIEMTDTAKLELQILWRGNLSFQIMNGDYLGPTPEAVVQMYNGFLGRAPEAR